ADLKLGNTELGLVFSAFAFPYALFQLIGGWIGDRFGAWLVLTACLIMVALSTALTGAAGGLASLFAIRLAVGFGEGAAFPTATRAMASWTPAGSWGFAQGIVHAAARIGNAVTPPLVTALLAFGSWRAVFVILGVASLVWPAIWMWFFRDDPREHPAITAEQLATLPTRATGGSSRNVPWLRLARRMLPVTMVDFCYGWTLWLFLSWIPSFFFQNYRLNLQASALFSTGVFLAGVVGDTLGGVASDALLRKTGSLVAARRYVIVTGFLGAFVFLLPVVFIHEVNVAAICLSLAFFFLELIVGPIWSIPMDIAPRYAGSASGIMNFGFGVAGIISVFTFGYLVDRTGGWVFPFVASLVLLPIGAMLALRLRPDKPLLAME
ncbi:MAG TPA: MFS transporter, partial [Bryobacteraceae bacterium]|nr:MFS transporter [Bryobacteraceae bacterium]